MIKQEAMRARDTKAIRQLMKARKNKASESKSEKVSTEKDITEKDNAEKDEEALPYGGNLQVR